MSNTKEQDKLWSPSREQLLDEKGRPFTQSLFLELQYNDSAVYTLKDVDFEWKGKYLPSIKRLYIEMADPTEYQFATTYFLGWKHWLRICENKMIRQYIDQWRYELEVKLRSEGVRQAIKQAKTGSWQAAKWMADAGWIDRPAGRPSKDEIEKNRVIESQLHEEFAEDFKRLTIVK